MFVTHTTAHSNTGSSTHWVMPGIGPATPWFPAGSISTAPPWELLALLIMGRLTHKLPSSSVYFMLDPCTPPHYLYNFQCWVPWDTLTSWHSPRLCSFAKWVSIVGNRIPKNPSNWLNYLSILSYIQINFLNSTPPGQIPKISKATQYCWSGNV